MPSNDKDSVSNLVSVFSALNKIKDEPKGVSAQSSVVKDKDNRDDKVNPNLESAETERLKKIATVFGQTLKLGIYAPQPEAQKLGDLTPDKQKSLGISAISDKIKPVKQESDGLMGLLAGLLGLLGFGDIKSIMKKTLGWIGSKLKGILKWVGGKLWSGVKWLTGKLWSSVKWIGGKMWQGLKWLGTKVSSMIRGLVGKIKNSKAYKGLMGVVKSAASGIKNLWDNALRGITGFIDNLVEGITKLKDGAFNLVKKIPGYDLVKKGFEKTVQTGKSVGGAVVRGTKAVGGAVGGVVTDIADDVVAASKGKLANALKGFFKGSAKYVGGILKKAPIIGPLIEGFLAKGDIDSYKKDYAQGKISLDELQFKIGNRVVTGLTGMAGSALLGALGSVIGPVGTVVGAVGGDLLGRYVGGILTSVISPDITKKIGSFFQNEKSKKDGGRGWGPAEPGEMQDFFSRGDGRIYKFSSKDDLLGMKTGGAIDNFLNSQPDGAMVESIVSHNKFSKTALIEQIKRQDTMIELLVQLVRKPTGGSIINNTSNNNVTPSNFRDAYSSQTLVTN